MAHDRHSVKGDGRQSDALEFEQQYQLMSEALNHDDDGALHRHGSAWGGAVVARIVKQMEQERARTLLSRMSDDVLPHVLTELDDSSWHGVVSSLGVARIAKALEHLPTDDVTAVVESLPVDMRADIGHRLSKQKRRFLEVGLSYPEKTAGRLMQSEIVAIPSHWTVGQTLSHLQQDDSLPANFFDVQVVDVRQHPLGVVTLDTLVRGKRNQSVTSLMRDHLRPIEAATSQEEVAFFFRDQNIASHPVVDSEGRLLGIITIDDVVGVIDDQAKEDFLHLGGVATDGGTPSQWGILRSRVGWLMFNLCATFATALVVAQFTHAIEQIVALAMFMPMVASMSGIAAVQSLTVTVRALAMKELGGDNLIRTITREVFVNTIGGVLLGCVAIGVIWLWLGDLSLGLLLLVAMIANLALAGLLGALMPWLFHRLTIDPAVASGPCVTALTDVIGFFTFLSLATLYLLD